MGHKWPGSIFKERGVTGLTNIELTPEFAMKLGASFGSSIGKGLLSPPAVMIILHQE